MPNPYMITPPQLVYDFTDSVGAWSFSDSPPTTDGTVSAGGISLSPNGQSIRLRNDANGANQLRFDLTGIVCDMTGTGSEDDLVHIRVGFEDGDLGVDLAAGGSIRVLFSTNGFVDYCWTQSFFFRDQSAFKNKWYILTQKKSDFTKFGDFAIDPATNWSNVNRISIYAKGAYGPDYVTDITLDSVWVGGTASPVVTLSFDDGEDSNYNIVTPDLNGYGWKATQFVNKDSHDPTPGANKCSMAELSEMHNSGHFVMSHMTTAHETRDTISDAVMKDEIDEMQTWIAANFYGPPYMAYTTGRYNQSIVDHIISRGYTAARGAFTNGVRVATFVPGLGHSALFDYDALPNQYEERPINLSTTSSISNTAAKVLALVDESIERGQNVHIYGHTIKTGATLSTDFENSEWDTLLAGLQTRENAGDFSVVPYHEYVTAKLGAGGKNYLSVGRRKLDRPPTKRIYPKTRRGMLRFK